MEEVSGMGSKQEMGEAHIHRDWRQTRHTTNNVPGSGIPLPLIQLLMSTENSQLLSQVSPEIGSTHVLEKCAL